MWKQKKDKEVVMIGDGRKPKEQIRKDGSQRELVNYTRPELFPYIMRLIQRRILGV